MKKAVALLVVALVGFACSWAQDDVDYRYEIGGALGGSFYRGQLNHKFFGQMGFAAGAVGRWNINPYMAVKTMLGYASAKGSTNGVADFFPADPADPTVSLEKRKYKLNGGIVDFSATYEYNFWPFGLHHGYQGRQRITPFLQLGLGACYGTAGKALSLQIPIGVGVKYKLKPRVNLGFDWLYHFSLSDKLDGFEKPYGIKSSDFANKDSYSTAMFYISYEFSPKCPQCKKND